MHPGWRLDQHLAHFIEGSPVQKRSISAGTFLRGGPRVAWPPHQKHFECLTVLYSNSKIIKFIAVSYNWWLRLLTTCTCKMSKQLSMSRYLPSAKRTRSTEEEEETQAGVSDNITQTSSCLSDRELTVTSAIQQSRSSNPSAVDDIALTLDTPPCQPTDFKFQTTNFSGKPLSFSAGWFEHYEWLEYSIKNDAAYFYACRMFGSSSIGSCRPEKAFTITGFSNWKRATASNGKFLMHNNSVAHKQATVAWEQYKSTSKTGSIADQLGNKREEMIQKNWHKNCSSGIASLQPAGCSTSGTQWVPDFCK